MSFSPSTSPLGNLALRGSTHLILSVLPRAPIRRALPPPLQSSAWDALMILFLSKLIPALLVEALLLSSCGRNLRKQARAIQVLDAISDALLLGC